MDKLKKCVLFLIPQRIIDKRQEAIDEYKTRKEESFYIIQIENDSLQELKEVCFFGQNISENKNMFDENENISVQYKGGILNISSGMFDKTYQKIMASFKEKSITIGLTYIQSTNQKQLVTPLFVKTNLSKPCSYSQRCVIEPISAIFDPFQNQTTVVVSRKTYEIGANTQLILSKIYPKTTLFIQFYDADYLDCYEDKTILYKLINWSQSKK